MSEIIAKKYVTAFCEVVSSDKWSSYLNDLSLFDLLFKSNDKFNQIIDTPDISNEKKTEFVLSLLDNKEKEVQNLIKLLGEKRRLGMIPEFNKQLKDVIQKANNSYDGVLYSSDKLGDGVVDTLANAIGKKSGTTIKLVQKNGDFDGVKANVDSLGLEIGFSQKKMESQIIEYILKAI
jgi:F-type H+-transporting ATPase subunit delta